MLLSADGKTLITVENKDIRADGSFSVPQGVILINYYAFQCCTALQKIIIPESVNWIGCGAFNQCTNLQQISIPPNVTYINDYAFHSCINLKVIRIHGHVTSIGEEAFMACFALKQISIPESVTSIGDDAFSLCTSLQAIFIDSLNMDERKRIINLLPETLKAKVASPEIKEEKILKLQQQQLNKILENIETNPIYRSSKKCHDPSFFPKELLLEINKDLNLNNPFYAKAKSLIDNVPLPLSIEQMIVYENTIEKIIKTCIEKASHGLYGVAPVNIL